MSHDMTVMRDEMEGRDGVISSLDAGRGVQGVQGGVAGGLVVVIL